MERRMVMRRRRQTLGPLGSATNSADHITDKVDPDVPDHPRPFEIRPLATTSAHPDVQWPGTVEVGEADIIANLQKYATRQSNARRRCKSKRKL